MVDIRIQSVTMVKTCFEFNTKKGIEAKKKKEAKNKKQKKKKKKKKNGGKDEKALLQINEQCSL